jgi:hypothetical protein
LDVDSRIGAMFHGNQRYGQMLVRHLLQTHGDA